MAEIFKRNGAYTVRVTYYDADGNRRRKSKSGFKTKTAARQAGLELEQRKYDGELSSVDPVFSQYFRDWFTLYKAPKASNATKYQYNYTAKIIDKFFPRLRISQITKARYQQFLNDFGLTHSKETMRKLNIYITNCVDAAVDAGIIPKSFTKGTTVVWNDNHVQHVEYLNMHELGQLTAYLTANRNPDAVTSYMVLTAIYTGMRLSEIAALTWQDVNFAFHTITINKSWDYLAGGKFKKTKTKGSNRVIKVNQELLDALADLKVNGFKLVFRSPVNGKVPTSAGVNKTLRLALKGAGIDKPSFHFHSLRHSHVALLIANDVPMLAISKRLGHTSVTITANRYAYLIDELRNKADQKITDSLTEMWGPNGGQLKTS